MGIPISSNFNLNSQLPLDARTVVADVAARDLIPSIQRYEGMVVYTNATDANYQLQGGITNSNWVDFGTIVDASYTVRGAVSIGDQTFAGIKTFRGSTRTDSAGTLTELVQNTGWTLTGGWTGDNITGFIHSTGTTTLSNSFVPTVGESYRIKIATTGRTTGSISISLGGASSEYSLGSSNGAGSLGFKAINTNNLVITPTNTFNGTFTVSVLLEAKALQIFTNSTGSNQLELRTGNALNTISIGKDAGALNSGAYNIFMGVRAGMNNSTGIQNTFVGVESGTHNTTGSYNSFFGLGAGFSNTTGVNNTAVGLCFGRNTTGTHNTAVGWASMPQSVSGLYNVAIGSSAMEVLTTGGYNTAIGSKSLFYVNGTQNTGVGHGTLYGNGTGSNNTSIGYQSQYGGLAGTFTSFNNTSLGHSSLYDIQTGSGNTVVGYNTGRGITTGSYNTIIGSSVTGLAAGLSNNIIIADGQGNQRIKVDNTGKIGFGGYGTGTKTGTGTYALQVDSSGNIVEGAIGGSTTPSLQAVTDIGNSTTNAIIVNNPSAYATISTIKGSEIATMQPGAMALIDGVNSFNAGSVNFGFIKGASSILVSQTNITGSRTLELPNGSGVLPISVNGVLADISGNITLSAGTTETASNGLTKTGNDIMLGGSLTSNTTINGGSNYGLTLSNSSTSTIPFTVFNFNSTIIPSILASSIGIGISAAGGTKDVPAGRFLKNNTGNDVSVGIEITNQANTGLTAGRGVSIDLVNTNPVTITTLPTNRIISKITNLSDGSNDSELSITGLQSNLMNVVLQISGAGIFTLTQGLQNFANDAGAAGGGIPINGLYRNGSVVQIRVT